MVHRRGGPSGRALLADPLSNKGVAFTQQERERHGLVGMLPPGVLPLELQARRAWEQLRAQPDDVARNVYLEQLHDRNEVLYFRLLCDHLPELLPIVYDPTVGEAVKRYSHEYRRPRGVYLSVDRPQDVRPAFQALGLGPDDVDLVVATDGEQLLGIGDWGVGGMQLSVGKPAVYTAAAGVHPGRAVAVMLDVGTGNQALLNDPLYVGNRHNRVRGEAYDVFVAAFVEAVGELFPHALLHWEDFGPGNGRRLLERYGDQLCTFNDDLQGTARSRWPACWGWGPWWPAPSGSPTACSRPRRKPSPASPTCRSPGPPCCRRCGTCAPPRPWSPRPSPAAPPRRTSRRPASTTSSSRSRTPCGSPSTADRKGALPARDGHDRKRAGERRRPPQALRRFPADMARLPPGAGSKPGISERAPDASGDQRHHHGDQSDRYQCHHHHDQDEWHRSPPLAQFGRLRMGDAVRASFGGRCLTG